MYQEGLAFEDELGLESKQRQYRKVEIEEMRQEKYKSSSHAAHVFIYCPCDLVSMKVYNVRAYILVGSDHSLTSQKWLRKTIIFLHEKLFT